MRREECRARAGQVYMQGRQGPFAGLRGGWQRLQFGLRKFAGSVVVEMFSDPVFGSFTSLRGCADGSAIEGKIPQVP